MSENTHTAGGKKPTAVWFAAAARSNHHPPIQQGGRGAGPAGREDLKWSCVTGGSPSPSAAAPGLSGRRKTKKKGPHAWAQRLFRLSPLIEEVKRMKPISTL